jgi:hypothetical protein
MAPIHEQELKQVVLKLQANKFPRSNRLSIEFFQGFWEIINKDLLMIIEKSKKEG